MAKYRGRTPDGKTRGKYVRKVLRFSSEKEEEVRKVEKDIVHLLSNSGYCITDTSEYREGHNIGQHRFGGYSCRERGYHVAGASIGVVGMYYRNPFERIPDGCPQYYVSIKMVTNDSLDDVLQKITDRFPDIKFDE